MHITNIAVRKIRGFLYWITRHTATPCTGTRTAAMPQQLTLTRTPRTRGP